MSRGCEQIDVFSRINRDRYDVKIKDKVEKKYVKELYKFFSHTHKTSLIFLKYIHYKIIDNIKTTSICRHFRQSANGVMVERIRQ